MILYKNDADCCACGTCLSICPQKAIIYEVNNHGFLYPQIDGQKCVECGLCLKVCDFKQKKVKEKTNANSYYVASCDKSTLMKSSSGGVFPLVAKMILEKNGVVFGARLKRVESEFVVEHIAIEDKKDLLLIQGSKYVYSNSGESFKQVKMFLSQGRKVLYCGTPCQIAGLKNYLRKDYKNLYLIDLICHGTPSLDMFNSFMKFYQNKKKLKVKEVNFREKIKNVDSTALFYMNFITEHKSIIKYCKTISYYGYFLNGDIYRESCYNCKYACEEREGDITIGDGWGFEKFFGHMLKKNGGKLEHNTGISTVIVNNEKGKEMFEWIKQNLFVVETDFETVSKYNHQLKRPTEKKENYDELMTLYEEKGYQALDMLYFRNMSVKEKCFCFVVLPLKKRIPKILFDYLKKIKNLLHK